MNLKKLLKKAPFALIASLVIVILLTMSVSAASNINDAAYQINMSVFNNISTDDHLDNQFASFTLNPQTYIDNYYLNSSLTGVAIRDAEGRDVIFMPPLIETNNWSVYLPYTPAGVQDFKLYLSQENLNVNQVLMPGTPGILFNYSNITINNNDSWRFDVEGLNVNGSNFYEMNGKTVLVESGDENEISDSIDLKYISIGSKNIYYKDLNSYISDDVNTTGKVWYNENTRNYYNYKNKTLYRSSDAIEWIQIATNDNWTDMIFTGSRFVAINGLATQSYCSDDGITFTTYNMPGGNTFNKMHDALLYYNNGLICTANITTNGSNGIFSAFYSNDGINWTRTNLYNGGNMGSQPRTAFAVTNGNIVCAYLKSTTRNDVYLLRNGTWEQVNIPYEFDNLFLVNNLDLLFYPNSDICYSILNNNGLQTITLPVTDTWNKCVYLNNKYYLLGNTYIISTIDGTNWTVEASNGPYLYMGVLPSGASPVDSALCIELKANTEQNVSLVKNNGTYNLLVNDALVESVNSDDNLYFNGKANILTSDLVNYFKSVKFSLNDTPVFEWNFSRDGNLYDATGNGNNAAVSYISTYSPNISITLSGFQPININQNNEGSEEGGGSSMIEPDEASITVIDTDSENWNRIPVFKELAKDLRNSDWPVDLVLSLVVVLIDMLLCFLIYRFTRNQLTSGIVALVLLGYFVIMGCIPLFALVAGVVAELAIMTKRKVISY